jgi:hypothetical protein
VRVDKVVIVENLSNVAGKVFCNGIFSHYPVLIRQDKQQQVVFLSGEIYRSPVYANRLAQEVNG